MMLLDYFGVFGWIMEKWTKSANLGNFGVLRRGVGIPRSSACPRCGEAKKEAWTSLR